MVHDILQGFLLSVILTVHSFTLCTVVLALTDVKAPTS